MNLSENNIIIDKLMPIIGSKIYSIGTEENGNLWIRFINQQGNIYILIMQSFFRICDSETILITDLDKYEPSDVFKSSVHYDEDNYDFKTPNSSILHEWIDINEEKLISNLEVKDIKLNVLGDLEIKFNSDISLTVYLETTSDQECWYFLEESIDKTQLLIVYGMEVFFDV